MVDAPATNEHPSASDESLRRAQTELLSCLNWVDRVCRENVIEYWIDSGTLLGAVRHGGFIPWDDDIDLCMTRNELDSFIKIGRKLVGEKYSILTPEDDPVIGAEAKICIEGSHAIETAYLTLQLPLPSSDALFIDIYVADPLAKYAPLRKVERSLAWLVKTRPWARDMSASPGLSRSQKLRWVVASLVPKSMVRYIQVGLDHRMRRRDGNCFGVGPAALFNGHAYPSSVIFPLGEEAFEGSRFPAPADSHTYLVGLYGTDYLTPPPTDQQIPHAERIWFDDETATTA